MDTFSESDYLVLLSILIVLAAIGLYYKYTGGKQSSTEEYILGNRNQSVLPVALSLVSSHMSGVSVLGIPAEVYARGGIYCITSLALAVTIPVTVHLFLPVFYKVGSSSIYEYLELRFGKLLRTLTAITFPIQSLLFLAVVLYAPALALETLSGLSSFCSILIVGSVCTFYSTIGGMKAVIMTDVIQFLLTLSAIFCIIVEGYIEKGSFSAILKIAEEGGRLNFSKFSLDPTQRHTWWSIIIGYCFTSLGTYAVHQSHVQRYLTLKDLRTAKKTLYITWPITAIFSLSMSFAGICLYARYHDCDPLMNGSINRMDQLVPYFAVDAMRHLPGIPGLIMAGVFSASLSSISATLNSLATVSVKDFISPVYFSLKKKALSDKHVLLLSKLLVFSYGCLIILTSFLAHNMAGILQGGLTLSGLMGGPMLAVFTLGMFAPSANEPGAIAGLLSGTAMSFLLCFGGPKPPVIDLPASTSNCAANMTSIVPPTSPPIYKIHQDLLKPDHYFYLYRISYWWNVVFSFIVALVVGYVVSQISHRLFKASSAKEPHLFAQPVAAHLKRKNQDCAKQFDKVYFSKTKKSDNENTGHKE